MPFRRGDCSCSHCKPWPRQEAPAITSLRGGGPTNHAGPSERGHPLWHQYGLMFTAMTGANGGSASAHFSVTPTIRHVGKADHAGRCRLAASILWHASVVYDSTSSKNVDRLPCDLTGEIEDIIVRTYRTLPHGVNYEAWGGVHPLTPHYRTKASDPFAIQSTASPDGWAIDNGWQCCTAIKMDCANPQGVFLFLSTTAKDDLPRTSGPSV